MIQKSLVLMKPDAVKRGLLGEILRRFERVGLKVVAAKFIWPSEELAVRHYPDSDEWKKSAGQHTVDDCKKYGIDIVANMGTDNPLKVGEMVKQWNVEFLTSGPVLAMILEGANAIERVRSLIGPTVPAIAPAGTIRGDYSLDSAIAANMRKRSIYNLVHASGSVSEAETEIPLWFRPDEILVYKRTDEDLYKY